MAGMVAFISCKGMDEVDKELECRLTFDCGSFSTRAIDPDEGKISDVSILIFDEKGNAVIEYYTPDSTAPEDIIIEGIDENGNIYRLTQRINTQGL